MEPTNTVAETVETQGGEVTIGVLPSAEMLATENISANVCDNGRYVHYNVSGNIFEVTAKYKPPITTIGFGLSGLVCSAMNSETNEKVAIKKIMPHYVQPKRTLREIQLLRHFNHENIIGIREVILPAQRDSFEDVYIVSELMDDDLGRVLRSDKELTKEHCMFLMYQILRGLKYIHSANVIHRDLKPGNLLVSKNCDLKICDFGLARSIPESHLMTEYVVTRMYRAPELLLNSSEHTTAIDVWSVGCIFMEMMNRERLFPGEDQVHQLRLHMELIGTPSEEELESLSESSKRYIRTLPKLPKLPRQSFTEKFPNVPPLAIDLVEKMLTFDPRQRITVKEALAHPYFAPYHDSSNEPECMEPFKFDLDEILLTEKQLRELIYREALAFNPEPKQ